MYSLSYASAPPAESCSRCQLHTTVIRTCHTQPMTYIHALMIKLMPILLAIQYYGQVVLETTQNPSPE